MYVCVCVCVHVCVCVCVCDPAMCHMFYITLSPGQLTQAKGALYGTRKLKRQKIAYLPLIYVGVLSVGFFLSLSPIHSLCLSCKKKHFWLRFVVKGGKILRLRPSSLLSSSSFKVNFTNNLQAAFPPTIFRQKNINTN